MTLPPDLLRPILERPFSDEPRLVAADWLDERGEDGDRERADFIRFQLAESEALRALSNAAVDLIRDSAEPKLPKLTWSNQ